MRGRGRPLLVALLLAAASGGAFAQTLRLELTAGEYVDARLHAPAAATVVLRGPDGRVVRRHEGQPGASEFLFVAPSSGAHELAVQGRGDAAARRLEIHERVPPTALARPAPPRSGPVESERLRGWIAAHGAGTPAFWAEVAQAGTPIAEPVAGSDAVLVTFLWRGAATASVRAFWPIRAAGEEGFARIPGSDVWHLSLRMPAATRMAYQIAPDVPQFGGGPRMRQRRAVLAVAQADPLNPRRWPQRAEPDPHLQHSVLELPQAPPEPAMADDGRAVPAGTLHALRWASGRLGNDREITVYLPPGRAPGGPGNAVPGGAADAGAGSAQPGGALPLLLLFDREAYLDRVPTPAILDRLIAAGRIPPLAAAFVSNPSRESRSTELPCNPVFADEVVQSLLPLLRRRFPVTADPALTVAAGSSYGGLASAWLGWRHPQAVGNVLSLSGSFWWSPERTPGAPAGGLDDAAEDQWLTRQFAATASPPLRWYLAPGLFERAAPNDGAGILEANRHLRDVLRARGHSVHYREFAGGHDHLAWRGELAAGLIALLGRTDSPAPSR